MTLARLPLVLASTLSAASALAQAPSAPPTLPAPPPMPGPATEAGAPALAIEHIAPACILAGQFVRLEATAKPADKVEGGRVYFRAEGELHWYYVEAERVGGALAATLPRPDPATKGVHYYIEVFDSAFHAARTPEHSPKVIGAPEACGGQRVAKTVPSASLDVRVPPAAPAVPPGFLGDGIKQ